MIANISTDEIIEKISIFKQRDKLNKANEIKAKEARAKELNKKIMESGSEIKNMLKICNYLINNGYCHKSTVDDNRIIIEINQEWLLDTYTLNVYSRTCGKTDTYAYAVGNDNIKTTGDTVTIEAKLGKETIDTIIKHLERFVSSLDETLQMFYKRLGKQLGVDLLTIIEN